MLNYFGINIGMIDFILQVLLYIWLGSSVITLLYSVLTYPEDIDIRSIIDCFIPPANILYSIGILVTLNTWICDWFKDLFDMEE